MLLNEEKRSLQQSNEHLQKRVSDLLPMEEKLKASEKQLERWNRVIQLYFPDLTSPNLVLVKLQELISTEVKLKNELAALKDQSLFLVLNEAQPSGAQRGTGLKSEVDLENHSLRRENGELGSQLRFVENKLNLTKRQLDSSNNLLSSFTAECELTCDEKTAKVIQGLQAENASYKEMAEEYDRTVKHLRAEVLFRTE